MQILEILTLIFYLIAFTFALIKIPFFRIEKAKKSLILVLWGYKLAAGVAFYLLFSLYQPYSTGGDSEIYFEDGKKLANIAKESPADYLKLVSGCYTDERAFQKQSFGLEYWNRSFPSVVPNDNRIVIRVNSLFSFISFGFYRVHLLFMAFLSFIGLFLIYKAGTKLLTGIKRTLLFAVFVIPSTVFWSAGDLKEPILVLLLGCFVYAMVKFSIEKCWKHLLILLIVSYLLVFTKPYVFALLAPCSIAFFLVERTRIKREYLIYLAVFACFGLFLTFLAIYNPNYSIPKILAQKQFDFISMVNAANTGSRFEIPILKDSFGSMLINSPMAIFNSLSRPWIWEPVVWPQTIAAIENLAVLVISILLILKFKISQIQHRNFALFALVFSVLIFILTGLITPNMGALVRYKSIGLPFMFIALVSGYSSRIFDWKIQKINQQIQQLKNRINRLIWED